MLRESVSGYVARQYTIDARREAIAGDGWLPGLWLALAGELGVMGAALPEEHGGFGGGALAAMVIAEQLGYALALEPYVESVVVGGALLQASPACGDLLEGLVAGTVVPAAALFEPQARGNPHAINATFDQDGLRGTKAIVVAGAMATHFLVSARNDTEIGLYLVEAGAPGVTRRDYRTIEGRPASDIHFDKVPARLLVGGNAAQEAIDLALDQGLAAICAEAVGVMSAMLEKTVAYAAQREQFGSPIGKFQALQHRMADMAVALERSRSMAIMATLALSHPAPERARDLSAAKAFISEALKQVAEGAVQVHGGIGTTDEIDISLYFKRSFVIQGQYGSARYHLDRMARLS